MDVGVNSLGSAQGEEEEYIYTNELLSSPRGSNLMLELEILCMHEFDTFSIICHSMYACS